ncbi:MAG: SIS domain-containing protein [Anaerolineae bacterium]|nr:SIS domain-containing protein [Anaerolineae bacterium]
MSQSIVSLVEREPALRGILPQLEAAGSILLATAQRSGTILVCGNGGSAADSEHIVGELMKGFLMKRPLTPQMRARFEDAYGAEGGWLADHLQGTIPAISLVSHSALITAFLNDVEPSMIFAQQVLGYGKAGDCLIALSTSGNSANVVNAVRTAHVLGLHSVGMTAETGGVLKELCECCICVPAQTTARAQEYHQMIYHALCADVEAALFTR